MKTIKLKVSILLPMMLATALALASFVFIVYHEEQEHLAEDLARSIQAVNRYYRLALAEQVDKLGATLEVISTDDTLRSALAVHDRKALLARALPVFQRLKARYNITHLYFYDKQRVTILRVHQPGRYGDTINHFTALAAEKTKALSSGVGLGPLGTFTLRAVLPVWQDGKLLGYIELGEEIDKVIQDMARVFNVDLVVFIDKQYLHQADWKTGMAMLGRKVGWGNFPDVVIASQTLNLLPQGLNAILSRPLDAFPTEDIELIRNDQSYRGRILTLRDAGKRKVGGIVVLRNMTARIQSTWNTMAMISGSVLLLGGFLFLIFYIVLDRTERRIKSLFTGLQESQLRLINAQHMAHLGNWNWNLEQDVLQCSDEAAHLLGLEVGDCPSGYEELLALVHPDDRDDFNDFIKKVRTDGGICELVHRIIRMDDSNRIVHHRAEATQDASGKVVSINASILDITELKQTEMCSERMGRILEHSWNEIYAFDADTFCFVEASDGACQNLGYSPEEMRQLTPLDLKPEFTREQFEALIGPLRRGEKQQISFESEHCRKDGSRYPVEVRLQLSYAEKPPVFIAIIQDISERKRYIEKLEHKALYDTLTELPNRSLLLDRLAHALKVAHREAAPLAVIMIDVARLREINDLLGHQNGDLVLKEVASRLQKGLRQTDTVARLDGDEFVIVLPTVDIEQMHIIARKIQKQFELPVIIEDTPLELEIAIGIAQYPDHGDTPAILLQHADIAMCVAKNENSSFSIYNPDDDPFSVRRLKLHGELRQAIDDKTMAMYYQPKINIKTGRVTGVEALARWPHPSEGMISPDDFIPMVEQSGLIRPFTLWVLEQTIEQSRRWIDAGHDLTVAVNLSARNLLDPGLAENILKLLKSCQVSPDRLILEITESAVMSRPEQAMKVLMRLHAMGLKLSIDDFGTGYSSLAYLKKLPVAELKIDYSFISGITRNDNDAVIVRSTIELAHNLGLSVVAEGVENREILDLLMILRCDVAQGYYFSRAIPAEELEIWLRSSAWKQQSGPDIEANTK